MKKIIYLFIAGLSILGGTSCQKFDNYDEPEETLQGAIIDKDTQQPFQTEVAENGVRMKLLEYSWSDNPTPYYFYVKQDGTFTNTKIFKGNYNIEPQGAFVPLVITDSNGQVTSDESVTMDIKGTVTLNFEVDPFLRVESVGEPVINGNSISVQVKITRGTSNPDYQQDLSDVCLFINGSSPYVGNNNYDDRYDQHLTGDDVSDMIGKTVTLTTTGELPTGRTWYIRVGARIDKDIAGAKRYNYTEVKEIKLP